MLPCPKISGIFQALGTAALLVGTIAAVRAQGQDLKVNPNTGETQEQFARRTEWWRDAKFGMFIHWGVYSVPAEAVAGYPGEWYYYGYNDNLMKHPDLLKSRNYLQVADYEKFARQFNPVKFDAAKIVKTAKDAGMKYIVITSKHHDGFCMFDSQLTDYTIVKATPFKRDPMKELARECKKQGIKLCFYHSIMDWHHPDYIPRRPWEQGVRSADRASLDRYIDYMKGQLRELLTHYGPIGGIWFDGGWEHNAQELHSQEVNALIRSLQPGILINDRDQLPEDYSTPEQTIPANALPGGRLWETCMTLNNTWGYARNDNNWKSADDLIHKLCDIAAKGGNFLLNVGPTDLGEIPSDSVERLERVGQWMKINSKSIYGTTKSPFKRLSFQGRCTQKGSTLYLQVFQWPEKGLSLAGLKNRVLNAKTLDGGESLPLIINGGGYGIGKPGKLDPIATVIEVRLDGPPQVTEVVIPISARADGSFVLTASEANIEGDTAQLETKDSIANIGYWTKLSDRVVWNVGAPGPGAYTVEIEYACPSDAAGSTYRIGVGDAKEGVTGTVAGTGDWATFKTEALPGTVSLATGLQVLRVVPLSMPHGAVMNLRKITLRRAP
jgi:alpha-L-fucosidase